MSHKGNTETFYREIINKLTETMKDGYNNEGIGEDTLLLMKKVYHFHFIFSLLEMGRETNSTRHLHT